MKDHKAGSMSLDVKSLVEMIRHNITKEQAREDSSRDVIASIGEKLDDVIWMIT